MRDIGGCGRASALRARPDGAMLDAMTTEENQTPARNPGDHRYLLVGGCPARLIDWSFEGIGAQLADAGSLPDPGQAVEVKILHRDADGWTDLEATVQSVDADGRTLELGFTDRSERAAAALLSLLARRLDDAKREHPPA